MPMNRRQFLAMQARKRAAGEPLYGTRAHALMESGQDERQADLLRDLQKGRIDLQEYRELGGKHR